MAGSDVLLSFVDRLSTKKKYLLIYLSKNGIGLILSGSQVGLGNLGSLGVIAACVHFVSIGPVTC
jgi:hypothetical protein